MNPELAKIIIRPAIEAIKKKPVVPKNHIDAGDTGIKKYSALEKAVQWLEMGDSVGSNIGASAGGLAKVVPTASRMTPALNATRMLGARLAPIQATLWALDSGRAVASPTYRKESQEAVTKLLDSRDRSAAAKSLFVAANTLARPISTTGALLRNYSESAERIDNAYQMMKETEQKLEELRRRKAAMAPPPMDRLRDQSLSWR